MSPVFRDSCSAADSAPPDGSSFAAVSGSPAAFASSVLSSVGSATAASFHGQNDFQSNVSRVVSRVLSRVERICGDLLLNQLIAFEANT